MSRIDELIAEHCPDGVEFKPIGSIAECLSGATPSSHVLSYWQDGTIPWMSSGEVNHEIISKTEKQITPEGFASCSTKMIPPNSVVIALAGQGKTRGMVARTRIELCTNQSLCSIIPSEEINSDFLYYFLKTQYVNLRNASSGDGARGGLNLQIIRNYVVPIPPLQVQLEIVRILDVMTSLQAELQAELAARRSQYEFYRDSLLSFNDAGTPPVRWMTLGELTFIKTGQSVSKIDIAKNPGSYPVVNSGREPLGFIDDFNTEQDPIGITSRGAGVGSVLWTEGRYFRGNLNYSATIRNVDVLNVRFLYHWLIQSQLEIQSLCTYQGIPALNKSNLEKLSIPVPSLDEQERIVQTLDNFDALVNDISIGLPAEIKARRQQYEYFRDQLLSFKELAA